MRAYRDRKQVLRERKGERMARHPDLQASNFSLLNSLDSQVLGSSDSLWLPSEPPDIRNWFSSYVYESPESNRGDDFEGCDGFKGSNGEKEGFDIEVGNKEKEENLRVLRIVGKSDEVVVDEKVASNGFVKGIDFVEDSECARKVLDSSDSLSLSSEPPNLKNWFSSYVYESPVLDTSDDFGLSYLEESECDTEGFNAGKSSKRKEENLKESTRAGKRDELLAAEKMDFNGFVKCNNSFEGRKNDHRYVRKGNHGVDGCKNSGVLNDLPLRRISEDILEEETAQNPYIDAAKAVENSSAKSPRKSLYGRDFTAKLLEGKFQTENVGIQPPGSKLDLVAVNGDSMRKPTSGSNNKENDGHDFAGSGFISTKKSSSKGNDENSLKRPFVVQSVSSRNRSSVSPASDKDAIIARKVLSETTNIQRSDALEIAGKWRCPQKNKPHLGPPLKQLRLEQWVRRM
ncbi:uncharacterized protein LOC132284472 [Cornus florida]|uniref:uncharacterized protein LOC132284472 n=1 Tax=Cornus florida TaxID=4283 RepID=UPI00289E4471|nr:uncharacterized protein LOC132284472 [Cornus florida]